MLQMFVFANVAGSWSASGNERAFEALRYLLDGQKHCLFFSLRFLKKIYWGCCGLFFLCLLSNYLLTVFQNKSILPLDTYPGILIVQTFGSFAHALQATDPLSRTSLDQVLTECSGFWVYLCGCRCGLV